MPSPSVMAMEEESRSLMIKASRAEQIGPASACFCTGACRDGRGCPATRSSRLDPAVKRHLDALIEEDSKRQPPPPIRGWQCPVCGAGVAPSVTVCPCKQPIAPLPPIQRDVWAPPPQPYKPVWPTYTADPLDPPWEVTCGGCAPSALAS